MMLKRLTLSLVMIGMLALGVILLQRAVRAPAAVAFTDVVAKSESVAASETESSQDFSQVPDTEKPIVVIGSERFVSQVNEALEIIRTRSPETHAMIEHYVGIIRQSERSGMLAQSTPPEYQLADPTAFYSVTWCASTIAHDAMHSKLYYDYLAARGAPVPEAIWTGRDAEMKCIVFQIEFMKRINGPAVELDHLQKQDGTHFDFNNDGKLDWDDYFKRNW